MKCCFIKDKGQWRVTEYICTKSTRCISLLWADLSFCHYSAYILGVAFFFSWHWNFISTEIWSVMLWETSKCQDAEYISKYPDYPVTFIHRNKIQYLMFDDICRMIWSIPYICIFEAKKTGSTKQSVKNDHVESYYNKELIISSCISHQTPYIVFHSHLHGWCVIRIFLCVYHPDFLTFSIT